MLRVELHLTNRRSEFVREPSLIADDHRRTYLEHHCARRESLHDFPDDWPEDRFETLIIHAIVQWEVDGVVFALVRADVLFGYR